MNTLEPTAMRFDAHDLDWRCDHTTRAEFGERTRRKDRKALPIGPGCSLIAQEEGPAELPSATPHGSQATSRIPALRTRSDRRNRTQRRGSRRSARDAGRRTFFRRGPGRHSVVVRDVVCRFGDKTALNGVDLAIAPGEIHALLGPNGAGKTTLIRALCGLVTPQQGTVFTSGRVGLVPSGDRSFYLRISALENLIFFARLHGLRLRQARVRAREVLDAVGLADVANRPVGRCSHGMQKRLAVARAVLVSPRGLAGRRGDPRP